MSNKRTRQIRAYPKDKDELLQISRELSAIQNKKVPVAEVLRRMKRVPNMKQILLKDAELKRRLNK